MHQASFLLALCGLIIIINSIFLAYDLYVGSSNPVQSFDIVGKLESFISIFDIDTDIEEENEVIVSDMIMVDGELVKSPVTDIKKDFDPCECTDPVWCFIPMPSKSHFNFVPPSNQKRWDHAACLASRGDQVLLSRVLHYFDTPDNMLKGSVNFAHWFQADLFDIFFNPNDGLNALVAPGSKRKETSWSRSGMNAKAAANYAELVPKPNELYLRSRAAIGGTRPATRRLGNKLRFPVITLGFGYYRIAKGKMFGGALKGGLYPDKGNFINFWEQNQHLVDTPFV